MNGNLLLSVLVGALLMALGGAFGIRFTADHHRPLLSQVLGDLPSQVGSRS